jgi:hypothetical protein
MLQRRSYIIGVASLCSIGLGPRYAGKATPEVEIFGHIHLLEHIHQSMFFGDLFYAMIVADWNDFCAFTMIHVVAA